MQQRFSQNEIKRDGKPAKVMNTSDMLTHSWILTESAENGNNGIKKKSGEVTSLSS
jgi:hypothetical protein